MIYNVLHDILWENRVGIQIPSIEVRFENLSVEGDAYLGTRALPTLLNTTLNAMEVSASWHKTMLNLFYLLRYLNFSSFPLIYVWLIGLQFALSKIGLSPSKKRVVNVLEDVSGIIRPSR